jgi:hypothetical protein
MTLTTQFIYNMGNITLYKPDMVHVAIALIVGAVLLVLLRYVLMYHAGFFIVWHESRVIASKKHILGDLILMKDIQTEMEKDLEQASLKATFQN